MCSFCFGLLPPWLLTQPHAMSFRVCSRPKGPLGLGPFALLCSMETLRQLRPILQVCESPNQACLTAALQHRLCVRKTLQNGLHSARRWMGGMVDPASHRLWYEVVPGPPGGPSAARVDKHGCTSPIRDLGTAADLAQLQAFEWGCEFDPAISSTLDDLPSLATALPCCVLQVYFSPPGLPDSGWELYGGEAMLGVLTAYMRLGDERLWISGEHHHSCLAFCWLPSMLSRAGPATSIPCLPVCSDMLCSLDGAAGV